MASGLQPDPEYTDSVPVPPFEVNGKIELILKV
jgi:hypothetical protein